MALDRNSPIEYELNAEFEAPEVIRDHLPKLERFGSTEWNRNADTL